MPKYKATKEIHQQLDRIRAGGVEIDKVKDFERIDEDDIIRPSTLIGIGLLAGSYKESGLYPALSQQSIQKVLFEIRELLGENPTKCYIVGVYDKNQDVIIDAEEVITAEKKEYKIAVKAIQQVERCSQLGAEEEYHNYQYEGFSVNVSEVKNFLLAKTVAQALDQKWFTLQPDSLSLWATNEQKVLDEFLEVLKGIKL